MMKRLGKFDWGWAIFTYCACTQRPDITISIFRKKGKGNRKAKKQISVAFWASFYCLKVYKREGSNFLQFHNVYCVKGLLRMLRSGGKIVQTKRYFQCRFNVLIGNVAYFVLYVLHIAKSVRHIYTGVCILILIIIFSFFIYLIFFGFYSSI